jgi:hypothetical protein
MKKILLSFAAITSLSMVGMLVFNQGTLYSNGTGAPVSTTCTACHGGTNHTSDNLTITVKDNGTDVTTYEAGKVYDVTVGFANTASSKVGFALSVNGGVLSVANGDNNVQKFGSYLTHTAGGTATTGGLATWTGKWTAPASGTIKIQVFINETNADNSDQGDVIYGKSVNIAPMATGINDLAGTVSYKLYPNPVSDLVMVSMDLKEASELTVSILGLDGRLISTLYNGNETKGMVEKQFSLGSYSKGVYFMEVRTGNARSVQKLVIQ